MCYWLFQEFLGTVNSSIQHDNKAIFTSQQYLHLICYIHVNTISHNSETAYLIHYTYLSFYWFQYN